MNNDFVKIYNQKLAELYKDTDEFAAEHPKIASRLKLGQGKADDPLTGRLLEGFAFLTARVEQKEAAEKFALEETLLKKFDPYYFLPIPACSIMRFQPAKLLSEAYTLPQKVAVMTPLPEGGRAYFTTCYPVTVRPIQLSHISYRRENNVHTGLFSQKKELKSCLRLTLSTKNPKHLLANLSLDSLRFFIHADEPVAGRLYELLMTRVKAIAISIKAEERTVNVPIDSLHPVGFTAEELLCPPPSASAFLGQRLLTEYFTYPQKFMFFDLKGLHEFIKPAAGNTVQLYVYFDRYYSELDKQVNDETLLLHCTPIINLFKETTGAFDFDTDQSVYHLTGGAKPFAPDKEVYHVVSLTVTSSYTTVHSLSYSNTLSIPQKTHYVVWDTIRESCEALGNWTVRGHETLLVIKDFNIEGTDEQMVFRTELLCTNRDAPEQLSKNADQLSWQFKEVERDSIGSMQCVKPITPRQYRITDSPHMAALGHICINQIAYQNPADTLATIKFILSTYFFEHSHAQHEKLLQSGIVAATSKGVTTRIRIGNKMEFCYCVEFLLKIDEDYFPAQDSYLFGCVLNELLARSCSTTDFYRLTIASLQHDELYKWEPKPGNKPIS